MRGPERPYLRLVRQPEPLGSYIRPLERDAPHAAELIASGFPVGSGFVLDARRLDRTRDLREAAFGAGLEVVLDTKAMELATPGGRLASGIGDLPWAGDRIHHPDLFSSTRTKELVRAVAETAAEMRVTAVLAPTHYLEASPHPWFDVDLALTRELRQALDEVAGSRAIRIYYPLISNRRVLAGEVALSRIVESLRNLAASGAVDAIWLRVHHFGSAYSGPVNLKAYIATARRLHSVGVPIIAERTGAIGLALLAFGAVAGIESGITHGERFDAGRLLNPPSKRGRGGIAPRVYLPSIAAFLDREAAAKLLGHRSTRNTFVCQRPCCAQGRIDMLGEPRRHFLVTRSDEVTDLARVPQSMRVERYFSSWLRLAADRATLATQVIPELARHRRQLDSWRATLTDIREVDLRQAPSVSPSMSTLTVSDAGPSRQST